MKRITLAHGGGGKLTKDLVQKLIVKYLGNKALNRMDDSAVISGERELAFTTDSYVIDPIFFPGGDIGKLAVAGTVNDLAMCGAKPLFISLSLIIEEGFLFSDLEKIVLSIKKESEENNVKIACGDTKVVNKGKADKIFINTSGIGKLLSRKKISNSSAKPGDKIIISGTIGDHGIATLAAREELKLYTKLKSDCASLFSLVKAVLRISDRINVMRDPTRGGLATVLNEVAEASKVGIRIFEDSIPLKKEVKAASEILGLDPLYIANEGKLAAFVDPRDADKVLAGMKKHPLGKDARIIGGVTKDHQGTVLMQSSAGGKRVVDTFSGEQLPRIC